ncbi:MAG: hypothetical protein K8S22_00160 [Betaproteobacteria bacterium]|nr:hypothetical protein [Betaproteobacteria bacterium]
MNLHIPDPRRYPRGAAVDDFTRLADAAALRSALECGGDAEITAALRAAPSQAAYSKLWNAVCDVANHAGAEANNADVVARVFALPLVMVAGSRRPASLPGALPDIAAVKALFEQHGALGPTRNFGFGNALCSLETIESITPGEIYAWTRDAGATRRELPPSAITIPEPGEQVHLRFLIGAGIAPAAEPSFIETASNIGVWGMPLTRLLAAQLAQANVDVLPLARPPLDVLRAGQAGRFAQLDTAFSLFMSNALRRQRGATGDPAVVISAHDDGDIRISVNSQFDDTLADGFRWPLHPLDDMSFVLDSISGLLAECRINNVQCAGQVLPALDAQGKVWYARARDIGAAAAAPSRH